MIQAPPADTRPVAGIPRESGDDPSLCMVLDAVYGYSPRERG